MMKTHRYFTLGEMIKSDTAARLRIDNTPTKEIERHLDELMDYLDVIREAWGSPIIVTSGYRCPELNKAVGGSATSSHTTGWAVDMHPQNGKRLQFHNFLINFLRDNGMAFSQLIAEKPVNGVPSWTHLAIRSRNGSQRCQVFSIK